MASNNNPRTKFNHPRPVTSNVNPLLRAAVSGFPYESEQSPILVPVSLNETTSADKEESKSNPDISDNSNFQPLTLAETHTSSTPSVSSSQQSYSSKLASYFPGVTTAFTNLSNTLSGASSLSSPPKTHSTPSTAFGSSSALSSLSHSEPPLDSYLPPPPPTFKSSQSTSHSPVNLTTSTTLSASSFLPPPVTTVPLPPSSFHPSHLPLPSSSNDTFNSVSLTSSPSYQQSSIDFSPSKTVSPGFFIPSTVAPPAPLSLPTLSSAPQPPRTYTWTASTSTSPTGTPVSSSTLSGPSVPLYPATSHVSLTSLSPPLSSPVSPGTPSTDGSSGFRLKGLKRPTYAPVPGLGTTPVTTTMAPPVLQSPDLTDYMVVESDPSSHFTTSCEPGVHQEPITYQDSNTEVYREVYHHWFFKKISENKGIWQPLSMPDSQNIESAFLDPSKNQVVPTDGGRYDVRIAERQRQAVYWKEDPCEVRRCSWFYKASLESRYIPYEESVSDLLEREYREAMCSNQWHKTIPLENGEEVIMYSAKVIVHHIKPDLRLTDFAWDSSSEQSLKPRIVSRGLENFDISEGEPEQIDHLLFLVHGIGSFCDLKFRPVVEVVDDFRSISLGLVASHFKSAADSGTLGRVEMLPISWHEALHSEESGIDKKLKAITLPSIPKLRYFTNDTLLDVLFYTSPVYCERIITAVCKEMNRLYAIFLKRNPGYSGGVSMGGHSLGSLILFDLLSHQKPVTSSKSDDVRDTDTDEESSDSPPHGKLTKGISYIHIPSSEGTSAPLIRYPQLSFQPRIFFAFGSPTGMFVNIRGIDTLGEDFVFPTCPKYLNIFHPFDPVAYRIEPLIVPSMEHVSPVLISHHKGRKRMHLELKDTLEYMGTALKQKLYDSMKSTWNKVSHLAMLNKTDEATEVTQALEEQLLPQNIDPASTFTEATQEFEPGRTVGKINGGNRVDYVLQEAPLESFNEYLFALSSHVCYWESNDTMLLVLKEIYSDLGVSADSQVPQQILPFDLEETGEAVEVTTSPQGPISGAYPPSANPYLKKQ